MYNLNYLWKFSFVKNFVIHIINGLAQNLIVNEYKKFKDDNDPDRADDMYEEDEDGTIYQIYYPMLSN